MATHLFGIRHHGPGSARSLRKALEALEPDCVLVEGPPDAAAVLPLLAHAQMQPPVALLIYDPDKPAHSAYYPFTVYSPEWQAIDYALKRDIPVRFMDLPQAIQIALEREREARYLQPESPLEKSPLLSEETPPQPEQVPLMPKLVVEEESDAQVDALEELTEQVRHDPLSLIAEAAGYSDGESWWEHMVEQRQESEGLFEAVQEMMTALRAVAPPHPDPEEITREAQREAWMRQTIRAAEKEGFQRIAVVCGAWHTPALAERPSAKEDAETLRGLPKVKVAATWIPWTYGRMTMASGYGAGVTSPAWYEHLWKHPRLASTYWMTSVAQLFREQDMAASPASVIEAVRTAETLAAVRDRPIPGLPELWEAARAVFCFGDETPMRFIEQQLIVGERLGRVPEETPMLPIQQDLHREQKRLRLPAEALSAGKDFDLRQPNDLERSVLLHRLNLLGIAWGVLLPGNSGKGSFHELWQLQWHPEFEVQVIEANVYGNTVREATAQAVREHATVTVTLGALTVWIRRTLLADLPEAIPGLMNRLADLTALTSDVPQTMEALPDLARLLRYGDARKLAHLQHEEDTWQGVERMVSDVVDGLIARVCIGLPNACSALNDEAAEAMYRCLTDVHNAIRLLQNETHQAAWNVTLERLADQHGLHTLLAGRCCRLLLDLGVWEAEAIEQRLRLALSTANAPANAAQWIDGFLRGSGEVLVHTDTLWPLLDRWLAGLPAEAFVPLLPLLRRTFSTFSMPLRRQIGERARGTAGRSLSRHAATDLDNERAERTLPLLAQLLGLPYEKVTS